LFALLLDPVVAVVVNRARAAWLEETSVVVGWSVVTRHALTLAEIFIHSDGGVKLHVWGNAPEPQLFSVYPVWNCVV
jgi:hypothetical protein